MDRYTQIGITVSTKDRLDLFKAQQKEKILKHGKRTKQFVTNSLALQYLLDHVRGGAK